MNINYSAPILIVDDEVAAVTLVKQLASRIGFENIDDAHDGEAALSLLRQRRYQLVISDWRMQPMTGLQLLRAIRQDEDLRHTRFLLMTASSDHGLPLAAKNGGADGYLLKPFTPQQLRAKVTDVLSGR
jgi:two-component system, chemotaxis family, chemotaxis protein CheY